MRSDNYLNVNEGDQADVGHDIVNRAMEQMSENNNILAQDILLENDEGSKCENLFSIVCDVETAFMYPFSIG